MRITRVLERKKSWL